MNCTDIDALSPLYLSGELDGPRADAFAAHLGVCSACAREVEQQTEIDARLRTDVLAEEVDSAELDQRIRRDIASTRIRPVAARWLVTAASVAAVLFAAALGYRLLRGPDVPGECVAAAQDHRIEVIDQQRRLWLSDRAALEALAESRGLPSSAVAALATTGYRLERGNLCRLDGRAFLHLVYSDGVREYSVYLRPKDAGDSPRDLFTADLGHEYLATVQNDRLMAIVVTDQSSEAALHLGRFAAAAL